MNVQTAKLQSGKHGVPAKRLMRNTSRKVLYKVGYTWNRGGRLKELRIRHLARKFFHLWVQKTFGRITISKARSHYRKVLLRKAFSSWKDEWWHARKEWTLTIRADCHFKYVQYSKVYQAWRKYVSIQTEEKRKLQIAVNFAVQHLLRPVWEGWELYVEVRRLKHRMHETAVQRRRLSATRWAWCEWQAMLRQRRIEHHQEELALQQWTTTVQSRAWLRWKNKYIEAYSLQKKEARAHIHFCQQLQRRALRGWITHTQHKQVKKQAKVLAGSVWCSSVVRRHWCVWYRAFQCRQADKDRLQIADNLARRATLRHAFCHWRNYVHMRSEKAERKLTAMQHHHRQLLCLGFKALVLNVSQCKTHQINKNISVQHHQRTIMMKYWKHWQMRLEQIEDRSLQPQMTIAVKQHRFLLLKVYLQRWREHFREHQHMQDLELRADSFFKRRFLPRCVKSWRIYAEQRMERRTMRERAELCLKEQLHSWAFYTWWERSTHLKEQRLAERMAVLHAEQTCLSRAWSKWLSRALQQKKDRLSQAKAETLYTHTLLNKMLKQWKHSVKDIQISLGHFEQAVVHDGHRCMRRALTGWREYVEYRKEKTNQLMQMNEHYERKLLKHMLEAWKQHHVQTQHISARVEKCYQQHQQDLARRMLCLWRRNVLLSVEQRENETRAKFHYEHCLLSKVLLAWRQRSAFTALHHCQQEETLRNAEVQLHRVRMQTDFRKWRKRHGEVREERLSVEKACRHHHHVLLRKSFRAWIIFNHKHKDYQVLKNKSTEWHKLKMCQRFFLLWKVEQQSRWKEAEQTELALWHWSLNLQAKVLYVWRQWVAERHRKHGRLAVAAQFYRDELLRQGVTHILIYTAHMSAFSTDMALHSHEESSRQLQAVVRRCFLRWKQHALWKPSQTREIATEKEGLPKMKKSVSFCLPEDQTHTQHSVKTLVPEPSSGDSIMSKLLLVRASRLQPRRPDDLLCSPAKDLLQHSKHDRHCNADNKDKSAPNNSVQKQNTWQTDTGSASLPAASIPVLSLPPSVLHPSTQHQSSVSITKPSGTSGNTSTLSCAVSKELLLPPSSFTAARTKCKRTSLRKKDPSLLSPQYFTHTKPLEQADTINKEDEDDDDEETLVQATFDPTESLTTELLEIKLDLQRYQQDRNQLQTWRKLQKVMRNWLQTTGSDGDTEERENIIQELNELEIRISALSVKLAEQKPTMICHVARISSLESQLQESR
ncbi:protein SFI1 homolog [Trichomycterus rosablanca]|uniref:protein SFI1 homolog n=1 Tax=Trichomycterus rosablanca TaxID=2290929 RepID=UPI002F35F0E3